MGEAVGGGDERGDVFGRAVGVEGLHDAVEPAAECGEGVGRDAEDGADAGDGDGFGQFLHQVEFGAAVQPVERGVHDADAVRLEPGDAGIEGLHQRAADAGVFFAIEFQHGGALIVREGEAVRHSAAPAADGDGGGFGLVGILGVGVVGEDGAGICHARHQPRAAGLVAMEGALGAQFGQAGIRVAPGVWVGGGQVEDAKGTGPAVGHGITSSHDNPR